MHAAELSLDCGSPATAAAVLGALRVEADDGPAGSSVAFRLEGGVLAARLQADDLAALRAAVNSVARLADAALRTATRP